MKTILVLAHDDAGQNARIQAALDLTRALDGRLSVVDVTQMPVVVADYYSQAGAAMLLADERAQEAANRTRLQAQLAAEDVAWDWADTTGEISECMARFADLADLIVVNRQLSGEIWPDMRHIAGAIAIHSGKPLVAMPDDVIGFRAKGRALIAWDGSPAVAETMRGNIPMLRLASAVQIFCVENGSGGLDAEEAAAYLSRHDIHAIVRRIRDTRHPADAVIRAECATWHASYCVMGAYGHSRLTETLFGGVTRRMLAESRVPLVLGH